MQRDVVQIADRCRRCGMPTAFLVHYAGLTDAGEVWREYRREVVEHTRADCERMETLTREEWPTLF